MKKLRETLRLKFESKLTHRMIGKALSMSAGTVSYYVRALQDADVSFAATKLMTDTELTHQLLPHCRQRQTTPRKSSYPEPNFFEMHQALAKKGVNLQLLWEEYETEHEGRKHYSYSQFCRLYRTFKKSLSPEFRHHYKVGEHCFIDFCGPKVSIYHPDGTVAYQAYIFVAALGASQYIYVEAIKTRNLEDWVGAHTRLFSYLGGVPAILVPDNEKSAVKEACYYDPDINPTYSDLADYYQTAVVPARPGQPKDKPLVEKAVQTVETWIIAKLRHQKFTNIAELNQAIKPLLAALNDKPMQKLKISRKALFEDTEQSALLALPKEPYILAQFKTQQVNLNYHVCVDDHYYSVPHAYIRKKVVCRLKPSSIDIFYQNQCIASHLRQSKQGAYTTVQEHMPNTHRYKSNWTPQTLLFWAQKLGGEILKQVEALLNKECHSERLYRIHSGLQKLLKQHGIKRIEQACAYANQNHLMGYRSLNSVLKCKLDSNFISANDETDKEGKDFEPINGHSNVRGSDYFQ